MDYAKMFIVIDLLEKGMYRDTYIAHFNDLRRCNVNLCQHFSQTLSSKYLVGEI